MGEQTQSQHQSQPPHDSNSQPLPATESPSPDLSKNPSNPSKIPIRPQKIRKLSSPASEDKPPALLSGDNNSSKAVTVFNDTNTSSITITTTKNRRRNSSQSARDFPKIIKPLSSEGEIDLALRHLRAADPLLANLIDTLPPPTFESHHLPFLALAKSILYQQLAYKAGTSIYTRFVALCGGEEAVLPDVVLSLSTQQLKQIGVSSRKASYLYDLANKYQNGILSDESVVRMDDRSLFTMLSMVKGIGSWSVHMFMIFSLHRPDVLPVSDLGVRKGVQLLYGLEELPRPSQMEQLCDRWRPYRSVGAWYMWRFVEGKGTPATRAAVALEDGVPTQQQIGQQQEAQMPKRSFLPRVLSSKLPFSTSKLSELKKIFHAADNSSMSGMMADTLSECERAPSRGETKRCVDSAEDMLDFATSVLGRNVVVRTTENTKGSKGDIVIGSVKGIDGGKVTRSVSCHQSLFPYLVYYCHSVPKVRVYEADLLDPKSKAKINHGVAICHVDTSDWSPRHGAFAALGSSPGKIEVCHWIFENDMNWAIAD